MIMACDLLICGNFNRKAFASVLRAARYFHGISFARIAIAAALVARDSRTWPRVVLLTPRRRQRISKLVGATSYPEAAWTAQHAAADLRRADDIVARFRRRQSRGIEAS